jgi:hypothetical protein
MTISKVCHFSKDMKIIEMNLLFVKILVDNEFLISIGILNILLKHGNWSDHKYFLVLRSFNFPAFILFNIHLLTYNTSNQKIAN